MSKRAESRQREERLTHEATRDPRSRERSLGARSPLNGSLSFGVGQLERGRSSRMARARTQCDLCSHNLQRRLPLGGAQEKAPPTPGADGGVPLWPIFNPILWDMQGAIVADSVKGAVRQAHYAAAATTLPASVTMITIHRRRPRGYWVRVWIRRGSISLPRQIHHRTSLKSSRAMIPEGMSRQTESPEDANDLVEVWS